MSEYSYYIEYPHFEGWCKQWQQWHDKRFASTPILVDAGGKKVTEYMKDELGKKNINVGYINLIADRYCFIHFESEEDQLLYQLTYE